MVAEADGKSLRERTSVWNSLEITKIIVAATVPLSIGLLGILNSASEAKQAKLSRVLDRRLEIWDKVGPKVRQMKDQTALIYRNSTPNLPEDQRVETIGAHGVQELSRSVDETLEVRPFFTPAVAQLYFDFSYCAIELVQATQFNAREGVKPHPRSRLRALWERTDGRYRKLIEQVRFELSSAGTARTDDPYPVRVSKTGSRETSMCLNIAG